MRVSILFYLGILWCVVSLWYLVLRHRLYDNTFNDDNLLIKNDNNNISYKYDDIIDNIDDKNSIVVLVFRSTVDQHRHESRLKVIDSTWSRDLYKYINIIYVEPDDNPLNHTYNNTIYYAKSTDPISLQFVNALKFTLNKYDNIKWIVKIDDLTYVIAENLYYYLSHLDPTESTCYGKLLKTSNELTKVPFPSSGAGFALSVEAVNSIIHNKNSIKIIKEQKFIGANVDMFISELAKYKLLNLVDAKDNAGSDYFTVYGPSRMTSGRTDSWYQKYSRFMNNNTHVPKGTKCCASRMISFHYMEAAEAKAVWEIVHNQNKWIQMTPKQRKSVYPKWPHISGYSHAPLSYDISDPMWELLLKKITIS